MSKTEKPNEEQVFKQEVADDELEAVAGGDCFDEDLNNCYGAYARNIYSGGFPNCAATVEDGSWCGKNDACYSYAIFYKGMKCDRAWR